MKKAKPSHQPSRRQLIWLIIVFLLIVGATGWLAINQIMIASDRTRFESVSKDKSLIASRLVATLGDNVISTREQDECFNAEQGPWDSGNLWCQVATVINLRADIDYASVGRGYSDLGNALGLRSGSTQGLFPEYWIETKEGMKCELESKASSSLRDGGARRIPFNNSEHIALAITCADRAREAFYTYDQ